MELPTKQTWNPFIAVPKVTVHLLISHHFFPLQALRKMESINSYRKQLLLAAFYFMLLKLVVCLPLDDELQQDQIMERRRNIFVSCSLTSHSMSTLSPSFLGLIHTVPFLHKNGNKIVGFCEDTQMIRTKRYKNGVFENTLNQCERTKTEIF